MMSEETEREEIIRRTIERYAELLCRNVTMYANQLLQEQEKQQEDGSFHSI